jgi:alkanesulfonate monooxygenase SsuD/methylene tetrahydromethanopterin reductase-like flavin-dependent oxidoreductase (luciferase family)
MRIGYLIDLNKGAYDQPMPTPEDAHRTMEQMIEEGIVAEKAGFHGLQVPHRHGRTEGYFPGPEQLLTILARETDKVMLSTFTFVATLYHPMRAAEQFAIVDNLSQGRLATTMSRGFHAGYWGQFGIPQEKLLGRFLEAVKIWQLAFKGERFDFDGKHWQVEQGILAPGPYQEGGWPIWGGGNASPEAIRRSATYGAAMTADPSPHVKEVWDERMNSYKQHAAELGKEPYVVMMRDGWVADTFEEAAAEFGTHFVEEWRFYFRAGIFTGHPELKTEEDITSEKVAHHLVMGTPEQCREQLEMFHEDYGVDYFTMRFRMPTGPSMEKAHEQIQRFGEEVVQPIHKKYAAPQHPAIPKACWF